MVILERELSYQDMNRIIADPRYRCGECGGRLNVVWGGIGWILRCGNDISHNTLNHYPERTQAQIEGEIIFRRNNNMDSTALTTMTTTEMAKRIDMARFPQDLTPADKMALAQAAISYGFDPLMGEISIFQGKPFISIDGRYRKAQETGNLDGVESRPATRQERTDWEIPDGDYFFRAEVYVKGITRSFVGWGGVRKGEATGGKGFKPIETNPQRMAEKRAEAQALRKAFHLPLPSIEDIGQEDNDTAPVIAVEESGIIEGQITEVPKQEAMAGFINLDWLKESIITLQKAKLSAWENKNIVFDLKMTYGVTGKTIIEAISQLDAGQAEKFVAVINRDLDLI